MVAAGNSELKSPEYTGSLGELDDLKVPTLVVEESVSDSLGLPVIHSVRFMEQFKRLHWVQERRSSRAWCI